MSTAGSHRVNVERIGADATETLLTADGTARLAIAQRLRIPEITALTCRFTLRLDRAEAVIARGTLDARVVQEDVTTLELFEAPLHEDFTLRFVPQHALRDTLDPEDPVDEIGYLGTMIDLHEAMVEQLALALDPYPREASG